MTHQQKRLQETTLWQDVGIFCSDVWNDKSEIKHQETMFAVYVYSVMEISDFIPLLLRIYRLLFSSTYTKFPLFNRMKGCPTFLLFLTGRIPASVKILPINVRSKKVTDFFTRRKLFLESSAVLCWNDKSVSKSKIQSHSHKALLASSLFLLFTIIPTDFFPLKVNEFIEPMILDPIWSIATENTLAQALYLIDKSYSIHWSVFLLIFLCHERKCKVIEWTFNHIELNYFITTWKDFFRL